MMVPVATNITKIIITPNKSFSELFHNSKLSHSISYFVLTVDYSVMRVAFVSLSNLTIINKLSCQRTNVFAVYFQTRNLWFMTAIFRFYFLYHLIFIWNLVCILWSNTRYKIYGFTYPYRCLFQSYVWFYFLYYILR